MNDKSKFVTLFFNGGPRDGEKRPVNLAMLGVTFGDSFTLPCVTARVKHTYMSGLWMIGNKVAISGEFTVPEKEKGKRSVQMNHAGCELRSDNKKGKEK